MISTRILSSLPRPFASLLAALAVLVVTFGVAPQVRADDTYHYSIYYRDMSNFAAGEQPYNTPMPLYRTKEEAEKAAKEKIVELQKTAAKGLRYTYRIETEKAKAK